MKAIKEMVGKTIVWQERDDEESPWEAEQSAVIDRVDDGDIRVNVGTARFPRIQWLGVNDASGETYIRVVSVK